MGFGSCLYEVETQKKPGASGFLSNSYSNHICPVCGMAILHHYIHMLLLSLDLHKQQGYLNDSEYGLRKNL